MNSYSWADHLRLNMFWSLIYLLVLETAAAQPYLGLFQYILHQGSSVWDPVPSPMINELNQREKSLDNIFRGEIIAMFFEKYRLYVRQSDYRTDDENDTVLTVDLFEFLSSEKIKELPDKDQKVIELTPWDTVWNPLGNTRIHRFVLHIAKLYERLWNLSSPVLECVCKPSRGLFVEWISKENVRHRVLFFDVVYQSKYDRKSFGSLKRPKSRRFHKSMRRSSLAGDPSFDS